MADIPFSKEALKEPWAAWAHWNRYTKRRLDAGVPIIQRLLKERKESTRSVSPGLANFVSRYESETGQCVTLVPPPTSPHHETGSINDLAAPKRAQAGGRSEDAGTYPDPSRQSQGTKKGNSLYRRLLRFIGFDRRLRRGSDRSRG